MLPNFETTADFEEFLFIFSSILPQAKEFHPVAYGNYTGLT